DAVPAQARAARLGAAVAGRPRFRHAHGPVAHLVPVVLHDHRHQVLKGSTMDVNEYASRRAITVGAGGYCAVAVLAGGATYGAQSQSPAAPAPAVTGGSGAPSRAR